MKRVIILSVLLILVFSFTGCGKKKTELTKDNIEDYLKIDVETSGDWEMVTDGRSMGQYVSHCEGNVTKTFQFINQKNNNFEDVKINIECSVKSLMHEYDFKFKNGGTKGEYIGSTGDDPFTQYTKLITVTLPYDCSSIEEVVELEVENIENVVSVVPVEGNTVGTFFDWEIVDVSGSVIEND